MTPTETLTLIRQICEDAPLPNERRTLLGWNRYAADMEAAIGDINRLCLDALGGPGLSKAELADIVRPAKLDEATLKAQRESWVKGDMD